MPHGSQMLSPRCNSRIVRITGRWDDAWFSTGLRILKNLKIRTQKLSDFACVFGILADSGNHGSRRTRAPIHFASNLRVLSRKPRGSSPKHLISRLGEFLCRFCVRIWPVLRAYSTKARKYRRWCRCQATAPRPCFSTPRSPTPPIFVSQLCRRDDLRFCKGIYLWLHVEQHHLPSSWRSLGSSPTPQTPSKFELSWDQHESDSQ